MPNGRIGYDGNMLVEYINRYREIKKYVQHIGREKPNVFMIFVKNKTNTFLTVDFEALECYKQ